LQVLELIIEESLPSRILICSEFDRILDLVQDMMVVHEQQVDRIQSVSDRPQTSVVLYNPKYCQLSVTEVDTMVICDRLSFPTSINVRRRIHLICAEGQEAQLHQICCKREKSQPEGSSLEGICKSVLVNACLMKPDPDPRELLQNAQSEEPEFKSS